MPKVKMLTSMAGIDFSYSSGDVVDCSETEALRFISAGIAEPIDGEKVERAVSKPVTRKAVKGE